MHDGIIALILLIWTSSNFFLSLHLYRECKRISESRRIADLWLKLVRQNRVLEMDPEN
jgi:hypothetical protein